MHLNQILAGGTISNVLIYFEEMILHEAVIKHQAGMAAIAEGLVVRPAASAQRHPIANLVGFSVRGNHRDATTHPNRAAHLFIGVLD